MGGESRTEVQRDNGGEAMNSRKMITAAEALKLLVDAQTKLAALEMDHARELIETVKELVMDEICRISNGGG